MSRDSMYGFMKMTGLQRQFTSLKDQFVINEPNYKNGVKINDIDPYDMGLKS